jgi:DNA-binding MarR family transcriptional regulator
MKKSIFNPENQQSDTSSKIIAGLERISEAFKVLLWQKAKQLGLSPIQIQILIFIAYHKSKLSNVSHLAREFNITKATISDAIKVLGKKELIIKDFSPTDSRSYTILLSDTGKDIVSKTEDFADPLKSQLSNIHKSDLENLFTSMNKLIYQLNVNGILTVQRTCYGCKFYNHSEEKDYCNLLNMELMNFDIRIDCPEFEARPAG